MPNKKKTWFEMQMLRVAMARSLSLALTSVASCLKKGRVAFSVLFPLIMKQVVTCNDNNMTGSKW